MTEALTVSQADRDAAEKMLDALLLATDPTMFSVDECEAEILQAFARHRASIEELEAILATADEGRNQCPVLDRFSAKCPKCGAEPTEGCPKIARANQDAVEALRALVGSMRGEAS